METSPGKRKRDRGLPTLPLNTQLPVARLLFDGQEEECDIPSPRTKVARKFDDMNIHAQPLDGPLAEKDADVADPPSAKDDVQPPDGTPEKLRPSPEQDQPTTLETTECARDNQASPTGVTSPSSKPPRSPPLSTPTDPDLFWQDSEITGHAPDDPNDDGYGINGVGFRPTPTIAWSRAQTRRKQLAEWRTREAREERDRRRERRKRPADEDYAGAQKEDEVMESPRKAVRVRFEDG